MTAEFVNSASNTATTAANYDITLPALLEGDLVVIGYGISNAADAELVVNTAGYTELHDLYADDTHDTNLAVALKFMGATPDTVVNISGPSSILRGGAGVVQIWRGIDPSTPIDVTPVPVTGINSATPDPAAISPATTGAVVLVFAAVSGVAADATGTAPAGYGNLAAASVAGNTDSFTVMSASKVWAGGTEDPGTFTDFAVDGGTPAACSWAAVTLALRPLAGPNDLVQSIRFDNGNQFFAGTVARQASKTLTQWARFTHFNTFFDALITQDGPLSISQSARFDNQTVFFGGTAANQFISDLAITQVPVDGLYIDLKISGNDLLLNAGGEPALLDDRDSIAQDTMHLIRESGLLVEIIGQRDPIKISGNVQRLELLIEDDVRLVPGTIKITPIDKELYYITADTVQFGPIEFYLGF